LRSGSLILEKGTRDPKPSLEEVCLWCNSGDDDWSAGRTIGVQGGGPQQGVRDGDDGIEEKVNKSLQEANE
jgi:hypothetical protein